jgi:hypothetical protein
MNTSIPWAICVVLFVLLVASTLGSCGTPVSGKPFNPDAPAFPTTKGVNLNGRTFEIPSGFDAPYQVLLVAFRREQQQDIDTWVDAAREIAADFPNVEYYELPTINSAWGVMRGWIDGGMRSGIPATAARERTVTIYTDTSKFRDIAGIDGPSQIWVGLVDREGRVYWSRRGRATQESKEELRREVKRVASPGA